MESKYRESKRGQRGSIGEVSEGGRMPGVLGFRGIRVRREESLFDILAISSIKESAIAEALTNSFFRHSTDLSRLNLIIASATAYSIFESSF